LKLSISEGDVSLSPKTDTEGLSIEIFSVIAWRPEMEHLTMQSMMTMHYLPQLDRKPIRYAVSWIVAIATSMVGVVAYA